MFIVRNYSRYFYLRCSIRYQSSTSNDLTKIESSTEIEKKSTLNTSLWATSETNRLIDYLSMRIQKIGPITVADFMQEAWKNPKYGFNNRHEVSGKIADSFVSKEITELYAEMIVKWLTNEHRTIGGNTMQFVQMGPGKGILLNNIIKLLKQQKYSHLYTFFALYEPNVLMRRRQAEILLNRSFTPTIANDYRVKDGNYSVIWIDDFKQLLHNDTYFLASEFFNNYPIHKFQKTDQGWKEVMIDWNPLTKRLQYVLSLKPTPMLRLYENSFNRFQTRRHIEISPQRSIMVQNVCKHLSTYGGSALFGDYGSWGGNDDTFRAYRNDELVDPLSDPGNVDIMSDVNFEELTARAMQSSYVHFFGPMPQGTFLYNLGLDDRLTEIIRDKTPDEREDIYNDVEKLMPGHFVNEINSCVDESLIGYVRIHNHLELAGRAVISRSPVPSVALISGSGSGHEPAMTGFVGQGMLSACISGSIFASPPSSDIFRLIVEMKRRGAKQVLLIILNYTGDRLNFGLAMERARELAIDIDMLVIADDAAVENSVGPRGLAGALLVIKVAGALAEQGKNMSQIVDICQEVRGHLRTVGLAASGISPPGQQQAFELLNDEMELGMGIHGEIGVQKLKLLPCRQTVELILAQLLRNTRAFELKPESNVLLFVNNLGGCPVLEMGIVVKDAIENLERRKLHVKRVICGELMTSFSMKGFSLTVLKLTSDQSSNILDLLDAPTNAFAWPKIISPTQAANSIQAQSDSLEFNDQFSAQLTISESQLILSPSTSELVNQALTAVAKRLHTDADKLNRLDAVSGDGDTGTAFTRAADAITRDLINKKLALDRPSSLFRRLGLIAESRMGGTCGAICGLFFAATAKQLSLNNKPGKSIETLSDAFEAGVQSVESYARVQPGDKSLLDALMPAVDFIKARNKQEYFTAQDWKDLANITEHAAQETKHLIAKVGRASYAQTVGNNTPDPGATVVAAVLHAISEVFSKANQK